LGKSVEKRDIHMLTISSRSNRHARTIDNWGDILPSDVNSELESDIVQWSDIRIENLKKQQKLEELKKSQLEKQQNMRRSQKPNSKPILHRFLEKMSEDIPFKNEEVLDTRSMQNAYNVLREIIDHERNVEPRENIPLPNFTRRSSVGRMTYEVLQKIVSSMPIDETKYKPSNFVNNVRRLGRSLNIDGNKTDGNSLKTNSTVSSIESESDHVKIPVSTILPQNYAKNESIVEAIKETILVLSQEFSNGTKSSQNELDQLVKKIHDIPLIGDIKQDESSSKKQLLAILENIADFIKIILDENKPEIGTRAFTDNPVILIDGGKR